MDKVEPIQISLAPRLSDADRILAVRYLLSPRSLSPEERLSALDVFDGLGSSTITRGKRTGTFAAFYRIQVEDEYAAILLDQLLKADNPETTGNQLLRETWQQIVNNLQTMGLGMTGDIVASA